MIDKILNLIFPIKCEICGKLGKIICDDCLKLINLYQINKKEKDKFFIYKYDGKIRDLILSYKYKDAGYLYYFFEKCIIKNEKACNFLLGYDIIVPVPMHKKRRLSRGYNQTELISRKLALDLCSLKSQNAILCKQKYIQHEPDILIKTKNIKKQSKLNYKERLESSKGVYFANNIDKIKDKNILIFDDIYTTGTTYKECKKALLKNGAKNVGILTIARQIKTKEEKWTI